MKEVLLSALFIFIFNMSIAQHAEKQDLRNKSVCYAKDVSEGTRIFIRKDRTMLRSGASAVFEVNYTGFTPEAQAAFQYAVDIWASLLQSPVVIRIDATWRELESGVLGSASSGSVHANFEGALKINTWYPAALAEKMAGMDLNDPAQADIVSSFNSGINWYLGTDGNPGTNQYDLVSVVLHEIGHGLGFVDTFNYEDGVGSYGLSSSSAPMTFDTHVENADGQILVLDFANPSEELGTQLISNSIFFDSPTATANNGTRPKLYAPSTWSAGSSIAHLDENTYPAGNTNSLMSPQIGRNEVMHDPGSITLDILADMGWEYTYILHDQLTNTEDVDANTHTVTATITSDVGIDASSPMLFYSTDEFQRDTTIVALSPTGNADEFSAEIQSTTTGPQTYSYFITAQDAEGRVFTKPAGAPANFYTFSTGVDTEAPVIVHTPPEYVRKSAKTLTIEAVVKDFLPLQDVKIEYAVNNQTPQIAEMTLIDPPVDSIYQLTLDLAPFNLSAGDSILYSITATDMAASKNQTTIPVSGKFKIEVLGLEPAVIEYSNNFNTADNDFFQSPHFSVITPANFENSALHSDHPYMDGTGPRQESHYTIDMRVPIIIAEQDAVISFDEVVLVEPGEPGTEFGDDEFWDYVIVEGSTDGGESWMPFISGYDSRADDEWLAAYNSNISGSNSVAEGTSELYETRTIDMLENENFLPGDEVLIRFRLFADAAAHGWGWAIDNLEIQQDNNAPVIRHDHLDYTLLNNELKIEATITDNRALDSIAIVTQINGAPGELIVLQPNQSNSYSTLVNIADMNPGDIFEYRIVATDNATPEANVAALPSDSTFFQVPYVVFDNAVTTYSNNFNTSSDDFMGNFFSIENTAEFSDGAIHSTHPYPIGFGHGDTSSYTFTFKHPIIISADKPMIAFDEVVLVQPESGSDFNDYVVVEGSKDGGTTWAPFEKRYDSGADDRADWLQAYNAGSGGTDNLYRNRIINLLSSGVFSSGDEVLVRFKLFSNNDVNAWGWAIDNLEIQTEKIVAIEDEVDNLTFIAYPNPNNTDELHVKIETKAVISNLSLKIIGLNGQAVYEEVLESTASDNVKIIPIHGLAPGLYTIQALINNQLITKKLMRTR